MITGSDAALRSKTAQFIRSYFQCEEKEERGNIGKGTGADLIVELGSTTHHSTNNGLVALLFIFRLFGFAVRFGCIIGPF